jgi:hypothetical protein
MITFRIEKDVKREVKRLLDKHKWFWWCPPANAYGKSGISDFHAVRGGVFMAIETKMSPNKPTAMQEGFLGSIKAEGGFAFVVTEKTVSWFAVWLQAFDAATAATAAGSEPTPEDGAAMLNAMHELTGDY